jgi:hypothetical protein
LCYAFVGKLEHKTGNGYRSLLKKLYVPTKKKQKKHLQSVEILCVKYSNMRKDRWGFDKIRNKQRRILSQSKRAIHKRGIAEGIITCSFSEFRRCIPPWIAPMKKVKGAASTTAGSFHNFIPVLF